MFNCGKQGHLKRDCKQGIAGKDAFLEIMQIEGTAFCYMKVWQKPKLD